MSCLNNFLPREIPKVKEGPRLLPIRSQMSAPAVRKEAEPLRPILRSCKVSGHELCDGLFWSTFGTLSVSGHEVREKVEGLLSMLSELKMPGYEVREKVEGLLSMLSELKMPGYEFPEEMTALLSLWEKLFKLKKGFIPFHNPPTFMCGFSKLISGLSVWESAVKALLSELVSKLNADLCDRVPVFNESAISEAVKQAENLVSEFGVCITNFFMEEEGERRRRERGNHGGGRVVSAIPGIINRDRDEGIGGGLGGEGNGDKVRGGGRDVEDRRGEGNSRPKMDSSREAEIYTDRDCDPAPHIGGPTIPFCNSQASGSGSTVEGNSQASGSGSTVEGRGESLGGQDGGSGPRSQGEGSDGGIGGEGGGDEGIGGGIGGGGQGEGNGDEGGEEGRGRAGGGEIGGRVRNSIWTTLAEIFIAFNVQSTGAAIALHFLQLSSGDSGLLVSVLATNLVGFGCCNAALWQSDASPRASGILARIGSAATSLGFILMIAMILPSHLLWMIVLACLALLAVFILSFMS